MTLPARQLEQRPRARRVGNVLTPGFVRTVVKAGRYGDGDGR